MKRTLLLAAAGGAGLLATAFLLRSSSEPAPVVEASVAAEPARAPSRARTHSPEAASPLADGPLHGYGLSVHNDYRSGEGADGLLLSFEGKLTMGELGRVGELSWLYLHPQSLSFAVQGESSNSLSPEQTAVLTRELEQGYFAGRDAHGQIVEYRFAHQTSSVSQGFLRLIAVATQHVTPEGAMLASPSFTVREVDTAGEADVRYAREGEATWNKEKHAYTRLLSDTGLTEPTLERELRGTGTLDYRDDVLSGATLDEHAVMRLDQTVMQNDAEVRIALREFTIAEDASALRERLVRLNATSALALPKIQQRAEQDVLRELLGDDELDDLTAAAARLDAEDENGRRSLLRKLEADLKLHPDDAATLALRLRGAGEGEQSLLLSALANAETPEAASALRAVSADPTLSSDMHGAATAMLGFTQDPEEETVTHLERASRDPRDPNRSTATLALGNLADSLRTTDPERAETIVDDLLRRLRASSTPEAAMGILSALGNSGDPRLVDALSPWFAASHPGVRAGAHYALRLIATQSAQERIALGATSDPDPEVRARVMSGLVARPSAVGLAAASRALREDEDAKVRMQALAVIAASPEAGSAPLLSQVAENDQDLTVRESARSLLARGV